MMLVPSWMEEILGPKATALVLDDGEAGRWAGERSRCLRLLSPWCGFRRSALFSEVAEKSVEWLILRC